MLRVTIELVRDGDELLTQKLAQLDIVNDQTGTAWTGHYNAQLTLFERDGDTFVKTARIEDFDRHMPPVVLVSYALARLEPYKRTLSSGHAPEKKPAV